MIKSFDFSERRKAVVCSVGPALDFRTAAYFHCQCDDLLQAGYLNFVFDLSETNVLDSSGLGALFALYKQLKPNGGRVVFASLSKPAESVLRLIRSERVFGHYSSVEAALGTMPFIDTPAADPEPTTPIANGTAPAPEPAEAEFATQPHIEYAPESLPEPDATLAAPATADAEEATIFELADVAPPVAEYVVSAFPIMPSEEPSDEAALPEADYGEIPPAEAFEAEPEQPWVAGTGDESAALEPAIGVPGLETISGDGHYDEPHFRPEPADIEPEPEQASLKEYEPVAALPEHRFNEAEPAFAPSAPLSVAEPEEEPAHRPVRKVHLAYSASPAAVHDGDESPARSSSAAPPVEQPAPSSPNDMEALQDLLQTAQSYGLIDQYGIDATRVKVLLFMETEPKTMTHPAAKEYLNQLLGGVLAGGMGF